MTDPTDFNVIIDTAADRILSCLERAQAPHEIFAAIHAFRDFAEGVALIVGIGPIPPEPPGDGVSQETP